MPGEAETDLKIPRTTIEEENAAAPPAAGPAETDRSDRLMSSSEIHTASEAELISEGFLVLI